MERTIEEQVEEFEEIIGLRGKSSSESAMDLLKANMLLRGIDPDAMPDVELKREWFKEDDFGEDYAAYMERRQIVLDGGADPGEEANLDIEM